MKFSHSLKFNSVPDWRPHYINYGALKKLSYAIEKEMEKERQREADAVHLERLSSMPRFGETAAARGRPHSLDIVSRCSLDRMRRSLDVVTESLPFMPDPAPATPPPALLSPLLGPVSENGPLELDGEAFREPLLAAAELEDLMNARGSAMGMPLGRTQSAQVPGTAPVVAPAVSQADFQRALDAELHRVLDFFLSKQADLRRELEAIKQELESADGQIAPGREPTAAERRVFWAHKANRDLRDRLASSITDLYVHLTDLVAFLDMNRTGFRKIMKKHDKVTGSALLALHMPRVNDKLSEARQDEVEAAVHTTVGMYASLKSGGDATAAQTALQRHLRDHVVWERDTIWRDMVALERRAATAQVAPSDRVVHPFARWWIVHQQAVVIAVSLALFFVVLSSGIFAEEPTKRGGLAMLVLLVILWTSEALPLYVTSMLVPLLTVVLRVMPDGKGGQLPAPEIAQRVFQIMFSQVIMLLLGGFAIAAALSKHYIAKAMATNILSRVGTRPAVVVLANMFVATFASMWISNVAAPVLCFSLIQPILRTLPGDHPLSKALVMGIALASNIGGMTSPISSPQNIFAIELMAEDGVAPNWLQWFIVALPVAILCNFLIWLVLLAVYKPGAAISEVRPMRPVKDPVTGTQVVVMLVSGVTVLLWCCNSVLSPYLGNQGIVAIVPLAIFFGFGILSKDDFNGFLWHVVMLAQGGLVLGEAVKECGLLGLLAQVIRDHTAHFSVWGVLTVFCALVLVCTTFVSHTVGAMVILPVVQSVGMALPIPHPKMLVMGSALMCSGAMGLPVSGFPNMNAVSLEDATGKTYVQTIDFLKAGVISSFLTFGVITTLGYSLMWLIGY